jgi:hypothetical protein
MLVGQVWRYMPVILALGRLRQEDCSFKVSPRNTLSQKIFKNLKK